MVEMNFDRFALRMYSKNYCILNVKIGAIKSTGKKRDLKRPQ